jgi:hypothetical protein
VENITCENVEPVVGNRASTLEDSPHPTCPTQDSHSDVQDGRSRTEASAEPIQNPKSKIQNGKRPYVQTPARLAAARANLEKARAVPKEKVYRPTAKRLAANRANLAKAQTARKQELGEIVDRLDTAFPPLGEEISEEAVGPEFVCCCGSGKPFHQCCKERTAKTGIPGQYIPRDPQAEPEDKQTDVSQAPRTFFRMGSPKWGEEGVDQEAPDYGALEKAGRALVHRQRALFNEVRREGREVMRLLTQAAERTVTPTLQDILALAGSLVAVLVNPRLARRAQRLNRRVAKLLKAFVEKRFEKAGVVVSAETLFERLMAGAGSGLPPLSQRKKQSRPPSSRTRPTPQPQAANTAEPDPGLDLPEEGEEFASLVRRAFCAPQPESADEAVRDLIDDLAGCLWDRLHTFDVVLQCEMERLNRALDQMGCTLPDEGRNHVRKRCWSIEAELRDTLCSAQTIISFCTKVLPPRLRILMLRRYGPDPEIDRFCAGTFESRVGSNEFVNSKW